MDRSRVSVLFLCAAVLSRGGFALPVDALRAQAAAQAWLVRGGAPDELAGKTAESVETLETDVVRLHVAKLSAGGFVVLPADDRIEPVLAFSSSGAPLEADERNPLWALLTRDLACRVAGVAQEVPAAHRAMLAASPRTRAQQRWDALLASSVDRRMLSVPAVSDPRVDSFVLTRWDQGAVGTKNVYNCFTPNNYVCGCVATATAQVMRHYGYPTAPVSALSFSCAVDGVPTDRWMKGGVYDWANMPLTPTGSISDAQAQAIGKLTYDIGCSVGMDWCADGSGSSIYSARLRLKDLFGYASCEGVRFTDAYTPSYYSYSLARCKQVVIPCLDYGSPVVMSVSGAGGHAVVVDGYGYAGDDFYLHVNCGWGGSNDAWYCPPDLTMGPYAFSAIDGFIYHILPKETGVLVTGRVLDAAGAPIAGAKVSLKVGGSVKTTATSDARGIYALLAPQPRTVAQTDTYVLVAEQGGQSASRSVSVMANNSRQLSDEGGFYPYAGYEPTIGNTYGNDLRITGIAGVEEPRFDPESCLFYPTTNVTLSCATEGATIRYTTDGSDPTEASAVYSGPIAVTDDTTIRARAYKTGMNASPVVAATYTYDVVKGGPKGDYYVKPILISGTRGSYVIDDNTDYTLEPNEAAHTLSNGVYTIQYRTVWYRWTAPGSGTMTFTTKFVNPSYRLPSAVAIYSDDASVPTSTRTRLAMSKDYSSSGDYTTSVSLPVTQGTTYRIVGIPTYDLGGTFTLSWTGDLETVATATSTTGGVPVPYAWLDAFFPGRGTDVQTYEMLGNAMGANGCTVWQSYLAGLDPTNANSRLEVSIRLENGCYEIGWSPVSTVAETLGYSYRVKGKRELSEEVWSATNAVTRFFKVFLENNKETSAARE